MAELKTATLDRRFLSSDEIASWLLNNKDLLHYRPTSRDSVDSYYFSLRAVDGFSAWNASSAASRQFDVALDGDSFMFFFENGTSHAINSGAQRHTLGRDTGLVISADRYSGVYISEKSVGEGYVISRAAITKALVHTYKRPIAGNFEFYPMLDVNHGGTARILAMMRYFRDNILVQSELTVSPLAVASFQEMISFLMVGNLDHSYSNFGETLFRIAPFQVRKAREFLHANAHLPITMTDVADAVGVSVRALQLNFRSFLDTTPRLYLHFLRLDGVRRDLRRASPASTTVTEVAWRWGFTHMGRFAQEYRKKFGVKPSEDLGSEFGRDKRAV